ncbi:GDSL-type esterase/lipase family protein [Paenibacillus sanguinis]|uniref:GDSL-type esterase/lipase family protein n=1 Tax=Paenibacillus sanguinis TaxID=225906 RepID=UPI0003804E1B|nr:GDSL-type esterase/lipase family protein [Paenibacillus sanguinis]
MESPEKLLEFGMQILHMQQMQQLKSFVDLNRIAKKGGIVFAGDSITAGFPIHEMLICKAPMFNRGINGYRTDDVKNGLEELVFSLEPEKVFLLIGTNDLNNGSHPQEIVSSIVEICQQIKRKLPAAVVFVQSVYPVNRSSEFSESVFPMVGIRTNEAICQVNDGLRKICSEMNLSFIDLYPRLTDAEGELNPGFTYDGLHININGYIVVREELKKYV